MSPVPKREPAQAIRLRGVTKEFHRGGESLRVLDELDFDVAPGAFEALMGPSGSGKSTLLHLASGLDRATRGTIEVCGVPLDRASDAELAAFRARRIGIVFQSYNLIPVLDATDNVELPLLLTNLSRSERRKRAQFALRIVGLENRAHHYPRQLSGGQEQRVAIARAIVHDPDLIVADEPTGDLDRKSADEILDLFARLHRELGKTILMVTHDPDAAARAERVHHLVKGRLS
jgi:putative ABC transport system ATP-binding protein